MRAVCGSCDAPQPVDWAPGDLCVHCGDVARRELRCHWCAGWTPEGRFCRTCGAETLPDEHFAVGRMLKHAGVDQFSIPDRLAAFDHDQVENFTRIYQRQAVVVARLVDDLAFAERFLTQHGWADELDTELVPKLPLPDAEVAALRIPPGTATGDAERLVEIIGTAPLPRVRTLAALARLRLSPSPIGTERGPAVITLATDAMADGDPRIRDEAALTLADWRCLYGPERFVPTREVSDALVDMVRRETLAGPASIALRLLGNDVALDDSDRPSGDDGAFAFAMAVGDADSLAAALRNPQRCFAAAQRLAEIGIGSPLAGHLTAMVPEEIAAVLESFPRDSVQPTLHDVLLRLAEETPDARIRTAAVKLLVAQGRPADAARLVRIDPQERWIVQSVIQRMPLDTPELTALCTSLVAEGRFVMHQYGIADLAETGKLRDDFVPRAWSKVGTDELRCELLRFAEEQLKRRGDEDLHSFVLGAVFGPGSATVRAEAWWALKRWYTSIEYASEGPLVMDVGAIERFFAGVPDFLERFGALLADHDTLAQLTLQEKLGSMLRYAPSASLPAIVMIEPAWTRFSEVLVRTMRDADVRLDLRASIVRFFEHVASVDASRRHEVLAILTAVTDVDVPDLAYEARSTAARIVERFAPAAADAGSYGD